MRAGSIAGMKLLNGKVSPDAGRNGRIMVVDDSSASAGQITAMLGGEHRSDAEPDPNAALFHTSEGTTTYL